MGVGYGNTLSRNGQATGCRELAGGSSDCQVRGDPLPVSAYPHVNLYLIVNAYSAD